METGLAEVLRINFSPALFKMEVESANQSLNAALLHHRPHAVSRTAGPATRALAGYRCRRSPRGRGFDPGAGKRFECTRTGDVNARIDARAAKLSTNTIAGELPHRRCYCSGSTWSASSRQ